MIRTTTRPRATSRSRATTVAAVSVAAGALLALAAPTAAHAHIGLDATETAAGSYTVLTFGTPHGCGDSATTRLTISMPDGIDRVTPTVNPNWTVEKVMEPLAEPEDDGHGGELTERVASVVYTAITPLPSDLRDTVALSLQLPEAAAGETLAFPVLQECEVGENDWSEPVVDGAPEPEYPAPSIVVTEAGDDAHGGDHHGGSDDATATAAAETVAATSEAGGDVLARVLGIGGLVVGAVGVVLAITARRGSAGAK